MKNPGKKFEEDIQKSVPDEWFWYRLKDSSGSWSKTEKSRFTPKNICDFFIFTGHSLYGVECKSFKGKSMPYSNINKNQMDGLSDMCFYVPKNAVGCFILNFRDIGETYFFSALDLLNIKAYSNRKSISIADCKKYGALIPQTLKRTRYKYDLKGVFSNEQRI